MVRNKKKVVILGGGFSGVECARQLESEFGNDPTRTTALAILEPGFLLDVKMIQTANGKWISIEEASTYGYKDIEIQRLKEIVDTIQGLSDLDDPTKIVENYHELHYLVNQINEEKENLLD